MESCRDFHIALSRVVQEQNVKRIDESYSNEMENGSSSVFRKAPAHPALGLIESIDDYCLEVAKAITAWDSQHGQKLPPEEVFRLLESGDYEDEKFPNPWPLCSLDTIRPNDKEIIPLAVALHYRGLRLYNAKRSHYFAPNDDASYVKSYEEFLEAYEDAQNHGKRTLNAALADTVDRHDSIFATVWCVLVSQLPRGNPIAKADDGNGAWSLDVLLTAEMCNALLGFDKDDCIVTCLRKDQATTSVQELLKKRQEYTLAICDLEPQTYEPLRQHLRALVVGVCHELLGMSGSWKELSRYAKLDALRLAQGIAAVMRYCKGNLLCIVSREKDSKSGLSCVGQVFYTGLSSLPSPASAESDYLLRHAQISDCCQRWFFRKEFKCLPPRMDALESLGLAMQSRDTAEELAKQAGLDASAFNYDSLAATIRLAETLRPVAVHEGHQQRFSFVVGYPYLKEKLFSDVSILNNAAGPIVWLAPDKPDPDDKSIENHQVEHNEKLHLAKARILGNSGVLQGQGTSLFVDCAKRSPTINLIVRPDVVGNSVDHRPDDLAALTKLSRDIFAVRVCGQERIEIYHGGSKQWVWLHQSAVWQREQQWDAAKLDRAILRLLMVEEGEVKDIMKRLRMFTEVCVRIAQTPGEGASFALHRTNDAELVSSMAVTMTEPFPGLCDGSLAINSTDDLFRVATQDGGVMLDVLTGAYKGRRQWIPWTTPANIDPDLIALSTSVGRPYVQADFRIGRLGWLDECSTVEATALSKTKLTEDNSLNCKMDPSNPSDLPLLEKLWRTDYLVLDRNGQQSVKRNVLRWNEWYNSLIWGTKHRSCLGLSACLWDKAAVIVVSEDGGMNLFWRGKALDSSFGEVSDEVEQTKNG